MPKLDRTKLLCCAVLAFITLAVYWPVRQFDFTNYDDPDYIIYNPAIQKGVTTAAVEWAFKTGHASNWHPLTWISHMVDCGLYGLNPGGHHFTNLLFHTANTVLLFLVLQQLLACPREKPHSKEDLAADPLSSPSLPSAGERAGERRHNPEIIDDTPLPNPLPFARGEGTSGTVVVDSAVPSAKGAMWRSALVAALFAWHPLHVESVAWVSERKDVLSTFFWLLTLFAYGKYANEFKVQGSKFKVVYYVWALLAFALGLLSKPMVVTLPFVLLLLDYWPLARNAECGARSAESTAAQPTQFRPVTLLWLVLEKIPFFILAALECVATFIVQKNSDSVVKAAALPFSARVANALVSYVRYLAKTVWPVDLAAPYPFSHDWTFWAAAGAGLFLFIASIVVLWRMRAQPCLAVGWFWFLGTLVPVIGLVQVGIQAMADRYTYVPSIGLFIMLAWSIPARWAKWPSPGLVFGAVTGGVLAALLTCTAVQLQYWRNSVTLFSHTVEVTSNSILAEYNLAEALARRGDADQAIVHYQKALAIRPNPVEAQYNSQTQAHFNLGLIFRSQKKWPEAETEFRAFLRDEPNEARAHAALADVLRAMGRTDEAMKESQIASRLESGASGTKP